MEKKGKQNGFSMVGKVVWCVEIGIRSYSGEHYTYYVTASSPSVAERKAIKCHRARKNSPGPYVRSINLVCTIDA